MLKNKVKKYHSGKIISLGFLVVIFIGSVLLMLPISVRDGVDLMYIDALYTSTSAVCVTGLIAVDVADTFTLFGQIVVALLIQIGGLGVTSLGAGIILALGKKFKFKDTNIIKEALNVDSTKGIINLIKSVFITTLIFESIGAILSFIVFVQDYKPLHALWISIFHSIAAFNNSGFDILGNLQNLTGYTDDILLNIVTSLLIIFGGLGFLVIKDLKNSKLRWKKLSLHSKVVISTSFILIVLGTVLLRLTEDITWLGAMFQSVSARTAGFSTYQLSTFSTAGLFTLIILMFIGASPGSTGGGIKTSTLFVAFQGVRSVARNKNCKAFKYSISNALFKKSCIVILLGFTVVLVGTYIMTILEPQLDLVDILFEVVSAYGTVGLSTGVTQIISVGSKVLTIVIMYIGRVGPLTIISYLNVNKVERIRYPEGNISIG